MHTYINKNRVWFWKALETYGLGIYFLIKSNTFAFMPPRPTIFDLFDDPPVIVLLTIVGTLALVYSIWNIQEPYYRNIMAGSLSFVWMFFLIAFVFHDFATGQYISFESMYSFFVIASVVHEQIVRG